MASGDMVLYQQEREIEREIEREGEIMRDGCKRENINSYLLFYLHYRNRSRFPSKITNCRTGCVPVWNALRNILMINNTNNNLFINRTVLQERTRQDHPHPSPTREI